jgi:hypothetical protein
MAGEAYRIKNIRYQVSLEKNISMPIVSEFVVDTNQDGYFLP